MEKDQNKPEAPKNKKNPLMSWLNALMGTQSVSVSGTNQNSPAAGGSEEELVSQQEAPRAKPQKYIPPAIDVAEVNPVEKEDVIVSDLKRAKTFIGRTAAQLRQAAKPYIDQTKKSGDSISQNVQTTTQSSLISYKKGLERLIRTAVLLVLFILIVFIGFNVYRSFTNSPNGETRGVPATPTLIPYEPQNPSLYAEDPEILSLEENLLVLDRELANTNIRITPITLPQLDFNITF